MNDRDDIAVGPDGDENSVGVAASGSDNDTELDGSDDDEAALNGTIKVAVTVQSEELAETVQELFEEFGGSDVFVEGVRVCFAERGYRDRRRFMRSPTKKFGVHRATSQQALDCVGDGADAVDRYLKDRVRLSGLRTIGSPA